jgi:hypothetical protein
MRLDVEGLKLETSGRAVITNMHPDFDHEVLRQGLPAGAIPAHDGMRLASLRRWI